MVYCVGWAVYLCAVRGIWFDEIFSLRTSQHDMALAAIFSTRWLTDVHPPLFAFLGWAIAPLLSNDVAGYRLFSLVPLALTVTFVVWLRAKYGIPDYVVMLFALLAASDPYFTIYFAEFRSYFTQLCLSTCLAFSVLVLHSRTNDLEGVGDRMLALATAFIIIVALNLHFVATIYLGTFVGVEAIYRMHMRHWRWAALLLTCGAVGLSLAGATALVEVLRNQGRLDIFWVTASTAKAVGIILTIVAMAGGANVAALGAVLARLRRSASPPTAPRRACYAPGFFGVAAVAIVVASAVLLVVNLIKPLVVERYLISLIPLVIILIALFASAAARRSMSVLGLIVANAVVVATLTGFHERTNTRWEALAPAIRERVSACPTTKVHAVSPWIFLAVRDPGDALNDPATFAYGYGLIAKKYGFPVSIFDPSAREARIRLDRACPTLVWVAQTYRIGKPSIGDLERKLELPLSARERAGSRLVIGPDSLLFILPPSER